MPGENLARGFNSASDVINAWMNSPEHRQNVLSPNYQNVGFAVATGNLSGEDTVLVVEMLGSTKFGPSCRDGNNTPPVVAVAPGSPAQSMSIQLLKHPNVQQVQTVVSTTKSSGEFLSVIKPLINSQTFVSLSAGVIFLIYLCLILRYDSY